MANRNELKDKTTKVKKSLLTVPPVKGGPSTQYNKHNSLATVHPDCSVDSAYIITLPLQSITASLIRKNHSDALSGIRGKVETTKKKLEDEAIETAKNRIIKKSQELRDNLVENNKLSTGDEISETVTVNDTIKISADSMNISTKYGNINLSDMIGVVYNPSSVANTCPKSSGVSGGINLGTIHKPYIIPAIRDGALHEGSPYNKFMDEIQENVNSTKLASIVNLLAWKANMSYSNISKEGYGTSISLLLEKIHNENLLLTTKLVKITGTPTNPILGAIKLNSASWKSALVSNGLFSSEAITPDSNVSGFIKNSYYKPLLKNITIKEQSSIKDIPTDSISSSLLLAAKERIKKDSSIKEDRILSIVKNGISWNKLIDSELDSVYPFLYSYVSPIVYRIRADPDGSVIYSMMEPKSAKSFGSSLNVMHYTDPPIMEIDVSISNMNEDEFKSTINSIRGMDVLTDNDVFYDILLSDSGSFPIDDIHNTDIIDRSSIYDQAILASLSFLDTEDLLDGGWIEATTFYTIDGTKSISVIQKDGTITEESIRVLVPQSNQIELGSIQFGKKLKKEDNGSYSIESSTPTSVSLLNNGTIVDRLPLEEDLKKGSKINNDISPLAKEGNITLNDVLLTMTGGKIFNEIDTGETNANEFLGKRNKIRTILGIPTIKLGQNNVVVGNKSPFNIDTSEFFGTISSEFITALETDDKTLKEILNTTLSLDSFSLVDAFLKTCMSPYTIQALSFTNEDNDEISITASDSTSTTYLVEFPDSSESKFVISDITMDLFHAYRVLDEKSYEPNTIKSWLSTFTIVTSSNDLLSVPVGVVVQLPGTGELVMPKPAYFNEFMKYVSGINKDNITVAEMFDGMESNGAQFKCIYRIDEVDNHPLGVKKHFKAMRHIYEAMVTYSNVLISSTLLGGSPNQGKIEIITSNIKNVNIDFIDAESLSDIGVTSYVELKEFYTLKQLVNSDIGPDIPEGKPLYPIALGELAFDGSGTPLYDKDYNFKLSDIITGSLNLTAGNIQEDVFSNIGYRFWLSDINKIFKSDYKRYAMGGTHDADNSNVLTIDGKINEANPSLTSGMVNSEKHRKGLIEANKNGKSIGPGYIKTPIDFNSVEDTREDSIQGPAAFDMKISSLAIRPVLGIELNITQNVTAENVIGRQYFDYKSEWRAWHPTHFGVGRSGEINGSFLKTEKDANNITKPVIDIGNYLKQNTAIKEGQTTGSSKITGDMIENIKQVIVNMANQVLTETGTLNNNTSLINQLTTFISTGKVKDVHDLVGPTVFSGRSETRSYYAMGAYPLPSKNLFSRLSGSNNTNFIYGPSDTGWRQANMGDVLCGIAPLVNQTAISITKRRSIGTGLTFLADLINASSNKNIDVDYQDTYGSSKINPFAGIYRKTYRKVKPTNTSGPIRDITVWTHIPDIIPEALITDNKLLEPNVKLSSLTLPAIFNDIYSGTPEHPFAYTGTGGTFSAFPVSTSAAGTQYVDSFVSLKRHYKSLSNTKTRADIVERYTKENIDAYIEMVDFIETEVKKTTSGYTTGSIYELEYKFTNLNFVGEISLTKIGSDTEHLDIISNNILTDELKNNFTFYMSRDIINTLVGSVEQALGVGDMFKDNKYVTSGVRLNEGIKSKLGLEIKGKVPNSDLNREKLDLKIWINKNMRYLISEEGTNDTDGARVSIGIFYITKLLKELANYADYLDVKDTTVDYIAALVKFEGALDSAINEIEDDVIKNTLNKYKKLLQDIDPVALNSSLVIKPATHLKSGAKIEGKANLNRIYVDTYSFETTVDAGNLRLPKWSARNKLFSFAGIVTNNLNSALTTVKTKVGQSYIAALVATRWKRLTEETQSDTATDFDKIMKGNGFVNLVITSDSKKKPNKRVTDLDAFDLINDPIQRAIAAKHGLDVIDMWRVYMSLKYQAKHGSALGDTTLTSLHTKFLDELYLVQQARAALEISKFIGASTISNDSLTKTYSIKSILKKVYGSLLGERIFETIDNKMEDPASIFVDPFEQLTGTDTSGPYIYVGTMGTPILSMNTLSEIKGTPSTYLDHIKELYNKAQDGKYTVDDYKVSKTTLLMMYSLFSMRMWVSSDKTLVTTDVETSEITTLIEE